MPTEEIHQAMQTAIEHHQAGRLAQAEAIYRQVLQEEPGNPDALHLLGLIAHQAGKPEQAVQLMRQAIEKRPNAPEFYVNIAQALRAMGMLDKAVLASQKALQINPRIPEAHNNLGNLLVALGQFEHAEKAFSNALKLRPKYAEAYSNLGNLFERLQRFGEAEECYRLAIAINARHAEAHNNLGNVLQKQGRLEEAIAACREALALKPELAEAHNNLANALEESGALDEAIESYRRAISLKPQDAVAHSNLLFALNHRHPYDAPAVFAEHQAWGERHETPLLQKRRPHNNPTNSDRPLRIGYVSADFRQHPMAAFVEGILESHDKSGFHITCYADVVRPDGVTERLQRHASEWKSIVGRMDEQVAEMIRGDRIDVLVDLGGHTARSRVLVFARKPAPAQVSYLAYPNTTGMRSMDYRITDGFADPPGMTEGYYTEALARPAECMVCYRAPEGDAGGEELPVAALGRVTFGSFNDLARVSPRALELWAMLLSRAPESRMMIRARSLGSSAARAYVQDALGRHGISPARVELRGWEETPEEQLGAYAEVDIALDSFPLNGLSTTCEALWMGVPVVGLAGNMHGSRLGVSLLSNVGLAELVAQSEEQYVEIAAALAGDMERVKALRAGLRERMQRSALMDAAGFTRKLEAAYREMWEAKKPRIVSPFRG